MKEGHRRGQSTAGQQWSGHSHGQGTARVMARGTARVMARREIALERREAYVQTQARQPHGTPLRSTSKVSGSSARSSLTCRWSRQRSFP